MKHLEQLETLIRTLDADRDKLTVYNLLGTVYVTFPHWCEWKLRLVNDVWTVVNVRNLYNAVYPQPEYIPVPPPANVCLTCCGSGIDDLSGFGGGKQFRYSSVEVCPSCNGTGFPQRVVATDREMHDVQLVHEGWAA